MVNPACKMSQHLLLESLVHQVKNQLHDVSIVNLKTSFFCCCCCCFARPAYKYLHIFPSLKPRWIDQPVLWGRYVQHNNRPKTFTLKTTMQTKHLTAISACHSFKTFPHELKTTVHGITEAFLNLWLGGGGTTEWPSCHLHTGWERWGSWLLLEELKE